MQTLPHDKTAEASLLSASIQNVPDAKLAADLLSADEFYATRNSKTFSAVKEVLTKNLNESGPLDFPELVAAMTKAGIDHPENFLAELLYDIPLAVNVTHTAEVIRQKAVLRKIIQAAHNGIKACFILQWRCSRSYRQVSTGYSGH